MIDYNSNGSCNDKKGSFKVGKITQYGISVLIILALAYISILSPTITGLSTGVENQIVTNLNLTFDSYSAYSFELDGKPSSIKLSGEVEGSAKIYLLNGFDKYLVYETSENSGNLFTGFAIGIPSEFVSENNETELNETIVPNSNQTELNESLSEQINETINETSENNENLNNETLNNETVNEDNNETLNNETEEVPTLPELNIITFTDSCVETCLLQNITETIELMIEVNGTLTLTELTYTVTEFTTENENIINETVNETYENTTIEEFNETEINSSFDINQTTLLINEFVFVENVTSNVKKVTIDGTVTDSDIVLESYITLIVKDNNDVTVYYEEADTNGSFSFDFTFIPKASKTYYAEITADTLVGSVVDIVPLNIVKSTSSGIQILHEKNSYALGDVIRFEVVSESSVLDAYIESSEGNITEVEIKEDDEDLPFSALGFFESSNETEQLNSVIEIDTSRSFKPGVYTLFVETENETQQLIFNIGMVNINTKKSIYVVDEEAEIIIGVLDIHGFRVWDADVTVEMTSPSGQTFVYLTDDLANGNDGTYIVYENVSEIGTYTIYALAERNGTSAEYETTFEVRESVEFEIIREFPTVIYPEQQYASFKVTSNVNADDTVFTDIVPNNFEVYAENADITYYENYTEIKFDLGTISEGEVRIINYSFLTPPDSPMLYLLGEAQIDYDGVMFKEARKWTLAVDAVAYLVDSVWYYTNKTTLSKYAWEPRVICKDTSYNLTVDVVNLHSAIVTPTVKLQEKDASAPLSAYADIPTSRWVNWSEGNSRALSIAAVGDGVNSFVNTYFMINATTIGEYSLRFFLPATLSNQHIFDIKVINCTGIEQANRDMKIIDAAGNRDLMIPSSINSVVLPITNYDATYITNVNMTLKISSSTGEVDWFVSPTNTQKIASFPSSNYTALDGANFTTHVLKFDVHVPNDADTSDTYTARINVSYAGLTKSYSKEFTLQEQPVVVYNTIANTVAALASTDAGAVRRAMAVCNYGDSNISTDIREDEASLRFVSHSTTRPLPNRNEAGLLVWSNTHIGTSDCFGANIVYNVSTTLADGDPIDFEQTVFWNDTNGVEQTVTYSASSSVNTGNNRPDSSLATGAAAAATVGFDNITLGQTKTFLILTENSVLANLGTHFFRNTLIIPPGFTEPTNLGKVRNSGCAATPTASPRMGFPLGSPEEGWTIKHNPTGFFCSDLDAADFFVINFTVTAINQPGNFTPGGKKVRFEREGPLEGSYPLITQLKNEEYVIRVDGPLVKLDRKYYNATTGWTSGFPTLLGCQQLNASIVVFNKGNTNTTNYNITENYPSVLNLTGIVPTNLSGTSSSIIWGSSISFPPDGVKGYRAYNYTINVPFGSSSTSIFNSSATNLTMRFLDKNYDMRVACGASLSVSSPTFSPVSPVEVETNFNVSSTITNFGPGAASNTIAWLNYTGNFYVTNLTGNNTNMSFLGTLGVTSSDVKWIVNSSGVGAGTYTFCVMAYATENSTLMKSCSNMVIEEADVFVSYANAKANSTETGTNTGSWGFPWYFNVTVNSNSNANFTVGAYVSSDGGSSYSLVSTQLYIAGNGTQILNYTWYPGCADLPNPSNKVKFQDSLISNSTTLDFTLTKDTVNIEYFAGHNATLNRSSSQSNRLTFRLRDQNGSYLGTFGAKYYVTKDNSTYVSDSTFELKTNTSGFANFDFNPSCSGDYSGAERFEVGEQQWKITVNSSELSCYLQNDSSATVPRRLYVYGDISPTVTKPKYHFESGGVNFTQEDTINFLGSSVDDCGTALTLNVTNVTRQIQFSIIQNAQSYSCTENIELLGSNAYSCDFLTNLTTNKGRYNVSIFTNRTFHYPNTTFKLGVPAVFFIDAKKKFETVQGLPTSAGWGYPNWNFSVIASSGDPDNPLQVDLFMARSVNPTTQCTAPTCVSPDIQCFNCINKKINYLRNFTDSDPSTNTIGTWFYQFKFNDTEITSTSGTDFSVAVTKDKTNITYGGSGNASTVIYLTQAQTLAVRVADIDKRSYDVTGPNATVTFKLLNAGYDGGESTIGTATTNSSGYASVLFNASSCTYIEGAQTWIGEILSSEPNYNISRSENFTLSITLTGCEASLSVTNTITPTETFQYRNFTVNSTVAAFVSNALNVFAKLDVPAGWVIDSQIQALGTVVVGTPKTVTWNVNATTPGFYNLSVFANSTNAGNSSLKTGNFTVNRVFNSAVSTQTSSSVIIPGSNIENVWLCNVGDYRVATLSVSANSSIPGNMTSSSMFRVLTYDGDEYIDVLHSKFISTNKSVQIIKIPVVSEQINKNELGYCNVRIENIGSANITITNVSLEAYYSEIVSVRDIVTAVNGFNTTGIESSEKLVNVTAFIDNSVNLTYMVNVTLNVTNSTGSVFSLTNLNVLLGNMTTVSSNFTNINTTLWNVGNYTLNVRVVGNFTRADSNRTEILRFDTPKVFAKSVDYMCNATTESFEVIVDHPFYDRIEYTVNLSVPAGWSFTGAQIRNISGVGNNTFVFNITALPTVASYNFTINVSLNYSYPGAVKGKRTNLSIETDNDLPILKITRETPRIIGANKVFESQLVVHNKGCGVAPSGSVQETLSTGWTPANPNIDTNSYGTDISLTSSSTDLENNVITWTLGSIGVDKYAVLTYQIKAPTSTDTSGLLKFNSSWIGRTERELREYSVQTIDYESESHLEFSLEADQQDVFPQPEVRSIQPNVSYNYTLSVVNIGDVNATGWNVSLTIPPTCAVPVVYNNGQYSSTTGLITWQLNTTLVRATENLKFNVNCTAINEFELVARAVRENRTSTAFANSTKFGCSFTSGNDCTATETFAFKKPNDARYETLSDIGISVYHQFGGHGVTVGDDYVDIEDDSSVSRRIWQNYSLGPSSGSDISNYTVSLGEGFVSGSRDVNVKAYVDSTSSASGNITVTNLNYRWNHGKYFDENQSLFMSVKTYTYETLMQNPRVIINGSIWNSSSSTVQRTGGWGEKFNFTVQVRDRFSRNVTIYAWHKKGVEDYRLIGSYLCVNCDTGFHTIDFTYDYNGSDIVSTGGWTFKFNATNADGDEELDGFTYTVEQDDIDTQYVFPSNEVSINRNESSLFSVRVFDVDNQSYPNGTLEASGKIYVSVFTINSFESAPTALVPVNGFFNRTITNAVWCGDTSQYYLGKHAWYGGTEDSDFVKDNLTRDHLGSRNFTLVGTLINTKTSPTGAVNYTRGGSISFTGSVVDDCSATSTSSSTIVYNISRNGFVVSCTGDVTGACTITTNSSFPTGSYNVSMESYKSGYNNGVVFVANQFFLGTVPQLQGSRKIPSETLVPWGLSRYTFTVNVTDVDNDTVTTTLWIKNTSTGYVAENSTTCTNCTNYVFSTLKNFSYLSIAVNPWTFKFNASDSSNIGINETAETTFNVTVDGLNFTNFGRNNSIVNRFGLNSANTTNLSVVILDSTLNLNTLTSGMPSLPLTEVSFYVGNGSNFLTSSDEEVINGTTNFYRHFDPTCTYDAGSHNWYVEVNGSSAYGDNRSQIGVAKVQVYADANATYVSPTGATEYERGTTVTLLGILMDDCMNKVVHANVSFNVSTGSTSYSCGPVTNGTGNSYGCSFDTTGKNVGTYSVTMVGSKAFFNNGTDSETNAFEIKSTPALTAPRVNIASDGWGVARTFSINVTDNIGDNVTVQFWQNISTNFTLIGTGSCLVNCSAYVINFTSAYACTDIGSSWSYKFNATDTEGNSFESSIETFNIERDNVRVENFTGNATVVNLLNSTSFGVRVYDEDNRSYSLAYTATVSFNVTKLGVGTSTQTTIGSNSTNSNGYAFFGFTPDQSYNVGQQDWLGYVPLQTCYSYNTSDTFKVRTLTNAPELQNASVTPQTDGWGIMRMFNISVKDTNNTVNVSLWRASSSTNPQWVLVNKSFYSAVGNWSTLTFVEPFDPTLIGTWYYMFNATNTVLNRNDTGSSTVNINNFFVLNKETVLLEYAAGHNTISNRSGNQTTLLSFRVRDQNGSYLNNFPMKFSVTSDGSNFYEPGYAVIRTNQSGYANYLFDAKCSGEVAGDPKFAVGTQIWKISVNDSELSYYNQNDSSDFMTRNTSVRGDILLEFTTPDGTSNFTQEQSITYLGATTDDCQDALVATVEYLTNSSSSSFTCTNNTRIGANAFQCVYATNLSTVRGAYNATMTANFTNHYNNRTSNVNKPGLFAILAKKKLETPLGLPTSAGWGYPNWNFTVTASSGDPDNPLQVDLFMLRSVNPTTQCTAPTCVSPDIQCFNCVNKKISYLRNFTDSDPATNSIGTWFYQFKFNDTALTSTSGTDFSVAVTKDRTNISYAGLGNASTVIYLTQAQTLSVRVYDQDKGSYSVTSPNATVTFKLLHAGYTGGEETLGTATTNTTGFANFYFNASACTYMEGSQRWIAEILSSEPNYNISRSENFTLSITLTGCEASVNVQSTLTPTETFQYRNFTVNSTIAAFISNAENVFAKLDVPAGWVIDSQIQALGTVVVGTPKTVTWNVNATTPGFYNLSVFANSTNAGNSSLKTGNFTVNRVFNSAVSTQTSSSVIIPGSNIENVWLCNVGDYRVATLSVSANSSIPGNMTSTSMFRVLTYDGDEYVDILHSKFIATNKTVQTVKIPVVSEQINKNELGYCNVRIENIGSANITITNVSLEAYYSEIVSVRDIVTSVNGFNTTGIESSEKLVNVTAFIDNSVNLTYMVNVTLNVTNSTGSVFSLTNLNVLLGNMTTVSSNFTNINTTLWNVGNYTLNVRVVGNFTRADSNRTEILRFDTPKVFAKSVDYMCNATTESFEVIVDHPFYDRIEYTVNLSVPAGWSFTGAQIRNISGVGNNTFVFNITSSNSVAENVTINVSLNYTYPGVPKGKRANYSIEESRSIPILEVTRESPEVVADSTEFVTKLIVYNKGCSSATSISLIENVKSSWISYSPTIDETSGGTADIPNSQIRYSSDDLGTIRAKEYKILAYNVLSPSTDGDIGTFRYNLTWGSRNIYEPRNFEMNTSSYDNESHLFFSLVANGSFNDRSAEKYENQYYNLDIKNIGDYNIANNTWNITLSIPVQCNASNFTGTYIPSERKIMWPLGNLNISKSTGFQLYLNCTEENRFVMVAKAINDTRATTAFANSTKFGCSFTSGNSCSSETSFTFNKPVNNRYEKLAQVDINAYHSTPEYSTTINEYQIEIEDDDSTERIVLQNYSLGASSGTSNGNYSISSGEQGLFSDSSRNINVRAYADSTATPKGNITVTNVNYIWNHGKLFEESQNLFIDIHPFIFDLPTPTLQTPLNASLQAAEPVGLSWEAITEPEGVDITYSVYGDQINGSTLLETTSDNLYLWRNIDSGTYYWKITATDGTSTTTSETRVFTLDLCQPDTNFAHALNYSMSYNNVTDTILVWGNNGSGYTVMGNNESGAITFGQIYEFGRAVRGSCAVANPSSGSYTLLSRLEFGNLTSLINTTYVKTTGESISFGKQLQLNFNATLISGTLTSGGSPLGGSTLSFSGTDATGSSQGQLFTKTGSEMRLYDTGVSHTNDFNNSAPFRLYWNGNVKAKSSTLQNWYTIRLGGSNNTLEDLIMTDMGEGVYPATTQVGTLNILKSRSITTGGLVLDGNSNSTITALEVSEANNDVLVIAYNGTTNLINPSINFSNINWTTGNFLGEINRRYDYTPTITDSVGSLEANVSLVLRDLRGDTNFNLRTDILGTIAKQTITRAIYDYDFQTGDERGPHTLKVKKYGKTFQTLSKQLSAATVETLQLSDNPFTTLAQVYAENMTGIKFNAPTRVNYGDQVYTNFGTTGTLNNTPITQSEFFNVFGYDGTSNSRKLTLVTDTPNSNGEYSINYETGAMTFFNNQSGRPLYPVYSYGGNITIQTGTAAANCKTMADIYSYMQNNLSDVISTVDGVTYTMYVNLVIGNNTAGGCIVDSDASLVFEDGYTYSFSTIGGYIDLAGITAGGGSGGSSINPLSIENSVGAQYNPGDSVDIFSTTTDSVTGEFIESTVNVTIYHPNESIYTSGISRKILTGFYKFNTTLPSSAPLGTYAVLIRANDTEQNIVSDVLTFKVESASSGGGSSTGGLPLNMFNSIGTVYDANDIVKLFTTVVNSSGALINATVNVTAYYPNGTKLNGGRSTLISSGRFEYNFSAPAVEGTYRLDIDANYSTSSIYDTESFIVSIGGSGSSGNLSTPPKVQVDAPAVVDANTSFSITAFITDEEGVASNCDANSNLVVRNTLTGVNLLNSTAMTNFGTGLYNYSLSVSAQANYLAIVDCSVSGTAYTGVKLFSTQNVASDATSNGSVGGGTGGLPLNLFSDTGAFYSPSDEVAIYSIATDSNGALVNASLNVSVNYPNGLQLNNGSATVQSLGRYKYNFTLPSSAPVGTYQINLDANYAGEEIHDTIVFIISSVLQGLNNTINQINTIVNNINTTVNQISAVVNTINTTVNNINSTVNVISTRVDTINSTVNNINSKVDTINSTVVQINSTLNTVNSNVNAISSNVTTINSKIDVINSTVININSTLNRIDSTVTLINSTVTNILTNVSDIRTDIILINSTIDDINDATVGKITLDTDVGAQYGAGEPVSLIITTVNGIDELINSTVNVTVFYPNRTVLHNGFATLESSGRYNYSVVLPNAVSGTYSIEFKANYSSNTVRKNLVFQVKPYFEITSLVTSSPKYPNEAALIEATFATSNGSDITPDSINLTILKPPTYATTWASASKSDFTHTLGVWKYERSIESSPTTGTYIAHLSATYNGVTATETLQFRIATGGPYSVTFNCPATSAVGSALDCTLLIIDEGEVETESTCVAWVDTDGDSVADSGEPQREYSQETSPLENVTRAVSIDVPSSHAAGSFVVRVSCSYANSDQPDSPASDSVTFTSSSGGSGESGGGSGTGGGTGGGGGGGGSTYIPPIRPITGAPIIDIPISEEPKESEEPVVEEIVEEGVTYPEDRDADLNKIISAIVTSGSVLIGIAIIAGMVWIVSGMKSHKNRVNENMLYRERLINQNIMKYNRKIKSTRESIRSYKGKSKDSGRSYNSELSKLVEHVRRNI